MTTEPKPLITTDGVSAPANVGPIPDDATPELCPLTPCAGNIIIVRETPAHMRRKMIVPEHIKQAGRAMMAEAWVMAVGESTYYACGKEWPSPVKVGDRVLTRGVNAFGTHKREGSETIFEVLPFDAITAVVSKSSEAAIPPTRAIGSGVH